MSLRRIANLTVQIPDGSRLWKATGGPRAWSDEYAGLMANRHGLEVLAWQQTEDGSNGKNSPSAPEPPLWFQDADAHESKLERKARALLRQERAQIESHHN